MNTFDADDASSVGSGSVASTPTPAVNKVATKKPLELKTDVVFNVSIQVEAFGYPLLSYSSLSIICSLLSFLPSRLVYPFFSLLPSPLLPSLLSYPFLFSLTLFLPRSLILPALFSYPLSCLLPYLLSYSLFSHQSQVEMEANQTRLVQPYFRFTFLNGDRVTTSVIGTEGAEDWTNTETPHSEAGVHIFSLLSLSSLLSLILILSSLLSSFSI